MADLDIGANLGIIYKNGMVGVAIVFHKHRCLFKERKLKGNKLRLSVVLQNMS